jgi:hypothetical protein
VVILKNRYLSNPIKAFLSILKPVESPFLGSEADS